MQEEFRLRGKASIEFSKQIMFNKFQTQLICQTEIIQSNSEVQLCNIQWICVQLDEFYLFILICHILKTLMKHLSARGQLMIISD